jgi:hypothetical protein
MRIIFQDGRHDIAQHAPTLLRGIVVHRNIEPRVPRLGHGIAGNTGQAAFPKTPVRLPVAYGEVLLDDVSG